MDEGGADNEILFLKHELCEEHGVESARINMTNKFDSDLITINVSKDEDAILPHTEFDLNV